MQKRIILDSMNFKIDVIKDSKVHFFWGSKSIFSNFYKCENGVILDGIVYPTSEHAFHAMKAKLFDDIETMDKIINCKTPTQAKIFGRKVKNFTQQEWDDVKLKIMKDILIGKFESNPDLLEAFLMFDEDVVFVEASPHDKIWGIGYDSKTAVRVDQNEWGENNLGKILTELRKELAKK